MKIADKIIDLKLELMNWKFTEKSFGVSPYTTYNKRRILDLLELLKTASQDGFTYTNDNCDGFWGEATQDDIAEHVEVNVLESQQNE